MTNGGIRAEPRGRESLLRHRALVGKDGGIDELPSYFLPILQVVLVEPGFLPNATCRPTGFHV
jgi:hypothetical protein